MRNGLISLPMIQAHGSTGLAIGSKRAALFKSIFRPCLIAALIIDLTNHNLNP
jgi:hypothetical protein